MKYMCVILEKWKLWILHKLKKVVPIERCLTSTIEYCQRSALPEYSWAPAKYGKAPYASFCRKYGRAPVEKGEKTWTTKVRRIVKALWHHFCKRDFTTIIIHMLFVPPMRSTLNSENNWGKWRTTTWSFDNGTKPTPRYETACTV